MKFLTNKDVEILYVIKENNMTTKANIARNSKYIQSNLDHTFKKLEKEGYITISKDKQTVVEITKKGKRSLL
jgi:DNA-binding MarR family transcriptional regulator